MIPVAGEEKSDCSFVTRGECEQIGSLNNFHEGVLCSNEELNTNCERQSYSSCAEGLDGIYWFDSCGNRENIYDVDLDASFNGGEVLSKNESCSLASNGDLLGNQGTCIDP